MFTGGGDWIKFEDYVGKDLITIGELLKMGIAFILGRFNR